MGVAVSANGGSLTVDRVKAPSNVFSDRKYFHITGVQSIQAVETALSAVASFTNNELFTKPLEIQSCGHTEYEGTSGSLAIAYALLSVHNNKLLAKRIVLTGEVEIHGNVEAIGGVREKCLVAARYGYKMVLPESNRNDFNLCDAQLKAEIDIMFVRHIREVNEIILKGEEKSTK